MASLPPLAPLSELETRLGRGLVDPPDVARAEAALDDASALVRRLTRNSWVETDEAGAEVITAPDEVVAITLRLAVTSYTNPDGVRQESIGSYSYTLARASDSALTPFEMRVLGAYRAGQTVTTATTAREDDETVINLPEPE